jgi:hypothetical protein
MLSRLRANNLHTLTTECLQQHVAGSLRVHVLPVHNPIAFVKSAGVKAGDCSCSAIPHQKN